MRCNTTLFLFILTITLGLKAVAQKTANTRISVAFYNCENFFDPTDNPAKDDDEFTPGGKYHYTQRIYEQKLHNIATVIQNMPGGSDGPAIIGMAEVENDVALNALIRQPELARRNYRYVWFNGPDPRGINVAMVYNPKYFRVLLSEPIPVKISGLAGKAVTRDILHVYGILNSDTVHVFVNHWPSRRGGEDESGPKRAIAARVNKAAIDVQMKKNPRAGIIIMGDFNDNPGDNSIMNILDAKPEQKLVGASGLYNPWANIYKTGSGTEVYKHQWNLFDQIIISGTLLRNTRKLTYEKAEIFKPEFIIDRYKGHEGEPHRSFAGTRWINGYSDHFPVILHLITH